MSKRWRRAAGASIGGVLLALAVSACVDKERTPPKPAQAPALTPSANKAGPGSSEPTDFTPPTPPAPRLTEILVDLPALALKSKSEVDSILGKPDGSGDEGPYHNRVYSVEGLSPSLRVAFHKNKAEIFEASFSKKATSRKEALARIGIEEGLVHDPGGHPPGGVYLSCPPFTELNLFREWRGPDEGRFTGFYAMAAPSRY